MLVHHILQGEGGACLSSVRLCGSLRVLLQLILGVVEGCDKLVADVCLLWNLEVVKSALELCELLVGSVGASLKFVVSLASGACRFQVSFGLDSDLCTCALTFDSFWHVEVISW